MVFAAQAFIASPLTLDHDFLLETIDQIGIGSINSDATAIGDALTTAVNRLRDALPPDVQRTLLLHEEAGTTGDPAYQSAVEVYYERHLCRLDPWPDCLARTGEALATDGYVYNLMNGPSEFHCIGTLKDWDITERLTEIRTPTLLLSGRFDEATPDIVAAIHARIAGSEWIVFEESSHTPHLEEPVAFNAAVRAFLAGVEFATRQAEVHKR